MRRRYVKSVEVSSLVSVAVILGDPSVGVVQKLNVDTMRVHTGLEPTWKMVIGVGRNKIGLLIRIWTEIGLGVLVEMVIFFR